MAFARFLVFLPPCDGKISNVSRSVADVVQRTEYDFFLRELVTNMT